MVRVPRNTTVLTEEKILSAIEGLVGPLKNSLQQGLLRRLESDPDSCHEPELWISNLRGVSQELQAEQQRWSRRELKALGTLSSYCDRWLACAR